MSAFAFSAMKAELEKTLAKSPVDGPAADAAQKLAAAATEDDRKAAAAEIAGLAKSAGVQILETVATKFSEVLADDKNSVGREGVLVGISTIISSVGKPSEPFMIPLVNGILAAASDKAASVRSAATAAIESILSVMYDYALPIVLPAIFDALDTKKHWQTKTAALFMLTEMAKNMQKATGAALPEIVPVLSSAMGEAKTEVKTAALKTMEECCKMVGNRDIQAAIPALISCIARPAETPDTVHKLGATTFVQAVESPVLSILVPLLIRGCRERQTAIKRKSCVIIDNMAKLVDNPADAIVFLPRLLPEVEKVSNEAADPELRQVATKAIKTLVQVGGDGKAVLAKKADASAIFAALQEASGDKLAKVATTAVVYVCGVCANLSNRKNFEKEEWLKAAMTPFMSPFMSEADIASICTPFLERCVREEEQRQKDASFVQEDEGEDLCDCEFSLAYGGKILLNNAQLHLKKGRRYGLCGPNGAGKSTLMRAIANGQLDGFPSKDVVRTVYVEHDIDGDLSDMDPVSFVFEDKELQGYKSYTRDEVVKALEAVGFVGDLQCKAVGALSGGWKMKLALARSMLKEPHILLLDEPTNHLDVKNVAWLQDYLVNLKDVTSIIVSHDSSFLDYVCTNIIHYENRKLKTYRGNLSVFVQQVPEAKSYYELGASELKFHFPEPGFLEGVKTKDKAILKCVDVAYKYPNTERIIFSGATVYCTLNSRVACIGPNGAGKSTLIKVLTGETEPLSGTVWKHPNLRIAYVAQHAFHHIESHLEKSPNEYIQWRFAGGEDREAQEKETRQISEEEQAKMQQKLVVDGVKRQVEKLLGRRKLKKSYEYEVQWLGQPLDQCTWMTRDQLEELGYGKLVNEIDIKEAAAAGLYTKPLTAANVQKHLSDIGLEPEFGTHAQMRGLSGGQKVKVVLAAATWQNPHLVVLDEPTNYLDRDSLGALSHAIREFGGGVVIISHNNEFVRDLCPEKWHVEDGKVVVTGRVETNIREKVELKIQEETVDAFGNVIKIKAPKKKLSNKEKKALQKLRQARRERGEDVTDSEEED